ncbi:MAG TPA: tetratricopeptide repeat protein [Candidatus Saccharicenans sp.]|nr:tetratricopeptide repeat protein [Candidatus Saccharicenans sp.]
MKWSRPVSISVALLTLILLAVSALAAGLTPLQKAIQKGDIKKVTELLNKGANIDEWNFGTPLIMAASSGQLEIAKLLIERGANLNMIGQNGWTALGCAAAEGHSKIVDLLISKGADVEQAMQGMKTWAEWARSLGNNLDQKLSQGAMLIQKRAGQAYYASGQYEKAAAAFRARIQSDPREPQNYVWLAFSDLAIKKYDEAQAAAEAALKLAPDNIDALQALADTLAATGDYPGAINSLNKAVSLNPKNPWVQMRLGNIFFNLGNYDQAINHFRSASELAPDELSPLRSVMNVAARAGKYDEAISAASTLLTKLQTKDSGEVLGLRSFLYREKGLLDEAAADADKAAAIDPAQDWTHIARAAVASDRGDNDLALNEISAIKDPENMVAAVLKVVAVARKGDLAGAESAFSSISRNVASSTNALVIRNAGILLGLLEPVRQAHLDKAASLVAGSNWTEALNEYAAALRISNQAGRQELLSTVSALFKSHPELAELPEEARKHSLRAEVLIQEKDLPGAVKEFDQALGLAPFCPVLYYNQAVILANLRQYSQAVEQMKTFLTLAPEDQKAREAKDLIYQWEFRLERQAGQK